MKQTILFSLLALSLSLTLPAQEEAKKSVWYADFDKAVTAAKESGKDLFVDFTGSDWCHYCKELDKDVLSHTSFSDEAGKTFVLVKLDFPKGEAVKAKVPNPERNDELMEKHQIQGFPTVLLMTADGDVYGQTGFREGGVESYLKHLGEFKKGRSALMGAKAIKAEFDTAEADAMNGIIARAVDHVLAHEMGAPGSSTLVDIVRRAIELDPKNEKGLKGKAMKALLKSFAATPEELEAARKLDPKNEQGLLEYCIITDMNNIMNVDGVLEVLPKMEAVIEMGLKDRAVKESILANTAFFNLRAKEDKEKAMKYGTMLKALPDLDPRYDQLLEMIFAEDSHDHDHDHDDHDHDHGDEDHDHN